MDEDLVLVEVNYLTDTSLPALLKKLNKEIENEEGEPIGGPTFGDGMWVQAVGYYDEAED
jgi:hypothetical protein